MVCTHLSTTICIMAPSASWRHQHHARQCGVFVCALYHTHCTIHYIARHEHCGGNKQTKAALSSQAVHRGCSRSHMHRGTCLCSRTHMYRGTHAARANCRTLTLTKGFSRMFLPAMRMLHASVSKSIVLTSIVRLVRTCAIHSHTQCLKVMQVMRRRRAAGYTCANTNKARRHAAYGKQSQPF